nr:PREDICTED: protein D1-like isoform X2 [Bemisia tabaci]
MLPAGLIIVEWRSAKTSVINLEFYNGTVELGNDFIIHQLWREPAEILWPIDDFGPYFSLVFLAPDHPDPAMPRFREYLLWLVVNIRGMDIEEGDVIAEYIMPPPPEKKGRQRYVFLILQQRSTGKQKIIEEYIPPCPEDDARANFSTKNFMKKYDFHHIPAAGNFLHINWGMTL